MNRHQVVEWAPFKWQAAPSRQSSWQRRLLQEQFLVRQRGFLRRELLRWKDACWVERVVFWEDHEAADAAMEAAGRRLRLPGLFASWRCGDATALDPGVLLLDRMASYG